MKYVYSIANKITNQSLFQYEIMPVCQKSLELDSSVELLKEGTLGMKVTRFPSLTLISVEACTFQTFSGDFACSVTLDTYSRCRWCVCARAEKESTAGWLGAHCRTCRTCPGTGA